MKRRRIGGVGDIRDRRSHPYRKKLQHATIVELVASLLRDIEALRDETGDENYTGDGGPADEFGEGWIAGWEEARDLALDHAVFHIQEHLLGRAPGQDRKCRLKRKSRTRS